MGFIYDLRITVKLSLLIIAGLLGISFLVSVNMNELNTQLFEDRKDKTKTVVDLAYSQVEHFAQQAKQGKMSLEEAQDRAQKAISILRYDDGNYLWINDYNSNMVMHAVKPELNGKDLSKLEDKRGTRLFVEFVKTVKAEGAGFVEYYWPKPGKDEPVLKLSYVKGYKDWNWIVGSGIYVDDVDSIFAAIATKNLMITLVVALLMIGFSVFVSGTIRNSIEEFKRVLSEIHVDGNLQKRLSIKGGDEIGAIAVMVNGLLDAFKKILEEVKLTGSELSKVSGSMREKSEQSAQQVDAMHGETQMVASAVTEMTAAAQEVATNAAGAAEQAKSTNTFSEEGATVVADTVNSIQGLAEEVRKANQVITQLSEDSNQIWTIVEVINNIADQTNLLALNAAIEAARAGEQGRGFAVVADEVRSLAQKTQDSTKEIQEMISNVQKRAEEAVQVMEGGQQKAEDSVHQAEQTSQALNNINQAINSILEMNYQIAAAAEEQTSTTEEINNNVVNIKTAAEHNGELAKQASELSGDVDRLTKTLQDNIAKFKF